MRLRGVAQISLIVALSMSLGACAGPIIGGMTLGTFSTILDGVVSLLSGKSVEEHVLSYITGKDCNLTESVLHKDRKLCEEENSLATRDDFRGILMSYGDRNSDLLDRYGRARQQELAEAGEAQPVTPATLVTFHMYEGVPARGEKPGYAKIGSMVVYLMAPIYEAADIMPPKPKPRVLESAPLPPSGGNVAEVSIAPMH